MATRTSLYLTGNLEDEINTRARQRFGDTDGVTAGHTITRSLNLIFEAYKRSRAVLASVFTYEEMRFLSWAVAQTDVFSDIDDFDAYGQLADDILMVWLDKREDEDPALTATDENQKGDSDCYSDWTYGRRIDYPSMEAKINSLSTWEVIALVDGFRMVHGAERKDRELLRVFKGLRKPDDRTEGRARP